MRKIFNKVSKVCPKCLIDKPVSEFSKNRAHPTGLQSYCINCTSIINAQWRKDNPGYLAASRLRGAEYRNRYPERGKYRNALKSDKKRGFATCTKEEFYEIVNIGICYYCGFHGIIGVDRIDNSKGHIVGNMLSCCSDCNTARSDHFTSEEMKIFIGPAIARARAFGTR